MVINIGDTFQYRYWYRRYFTVTVSAAILAKPFLCEIYRYMSFGIKLPVTSNAQAAAEFDVWLKSTFYLLGFVLTVRTTNNGYSPSQQLTQLCMWNEITHPRIGFGDTLRESIGIGNDFCSQYQQAFNKVSLTTLTVLMNTCRHSQFLLFRDYASRLQFTLLRISPLYEAYGQLFHSSFTKSRRSQVRWSIVTDLTTRSPRNQESLFKRNLVTLEATKFTPASVLLLYQLPQFVTSEPWIYKVLLKFSKPHNVPAQ